MSIAPPPPACIRRPNTTWTTCPCPECRRDAARMAKLARNGRYTRVPHEAAAAVIDHLRRLDWTDHAIASATGVHHRTIGGGILRGTRFSPVTSLKIVNHGDPTEGSVGAIGTTRRLRGLARQQYDLQTIADATGLGFSTLAAIRSRDPRHVRSRFYTTLRDWTESVGMTVGPSIPARLHAERNGWLSLLAWDDIDDPRERPKVGNNPKRRNDVDEVNVQRLLAGQRIQSTKAEKDEALKRWKAAGKSERSLCVLHGWKDARYGREDAA